MQDLRVICWLQIPSGIWPRKPSLIKAWIKPPPCVRVMRRDRLLCIRWVCLGMRAKISYGALYASSFNATGIRSLCWRGDELVDWVGGGRAFAADGTERPARVIYGYRFDAATASPDGRFAVIYERLGTKGLLLHDGRIVRELDRSFYHAAAYEYPVVLFNDPDGRALLAHCPGNYCRIEFEEAGTGRPLTASADRKPSDFFHSRLAASPHGKRQLSAGWMWHPLISWCASMLRKPFRSASP